MKIKNLEKFVNMYMKWNEQNSMKRNTPVKSN